MAWQIIPYDGETEFKRFRIKNVALIQTVTRYLHNGDYVVVLGAHFSEKSYL
ncbi:MAG: hypothetical protein R2867_00235 [Caldilineaceae bacterium]